MRALQANTEFMLKDESVICIRIAGGGVWETDYFLKSSFQPTFSVWKEPFLNAHKQILKFSRIFCLG